MTLQNHRTAGDGEEPVSPVLVGCAGWSISRLQAENFASDGSQLERYARTFNAVEINSSFYRPHRVETYRRWNASVPDTFRFFVKVPRSITHYARLKNTQELLDRFLDEVHGLGSKLACLLVQLPPSLAFDADAVAEFFSCMQTRTTTPLACEPRHETWFGAGAQALLERMNIATVVADPPVVAIDLSCVHSELVYVRLHGSPVIYRSAYSQDYLAGLARDLATHQRAGRQVMCIFDNTANGAAIPDALALLGTLDDVLKRI